jgi:peptidoglycan/LPS O-acetylase OafA/YrhL
VLRLRWVALGMSLAGWALLMSLDGPHAAAPLLRGALGWWGIAAACGWAQRAFTRESPGLRRAAAAVFCLYILHQSVIVVLSQWLKPLGLPWGLEALLLIVLTFAICAAAYLALRRVPGLALLLGIQRGARRGDAPQAARPAARPGTASSSPDSRALRP